MTSNDDRVPAPGTAGTSDGDRPLRGAEDAPTQQTPAQPVPPPPPPVRPPSYGYASGGSGTPQTTPQARAPYPYGPPPPVPPPLPPRAPSAQPGGGATGHPTVPTPPPAAPDAAAPVTGPLPGPSEQSALPTPAAPAPSKQGHTTRTLVIFAVLAGLIGGLIGGGAVLVAGGDEGTVASAPSSGSGTGSSSSSGTPPLAERPPESVAGISQRVLPSTAFIAVQGAALAGSGSGVVLDEEGNILTNDHVVAPAATSGTIQVQLPDGTSGPASIVGRVPSMDLAVINVDVNSDALEPATIGDSEALVVGDPVVAVGAPLGLTGTVTQGIVSALDRPVTVGGGGQQAVFSGIQTDAAINPGNSGGPLANANGEVVGINSAIASLGGSPLLGQQGGSIGVGFAIPMSQAGRIAQELIATGEATRASLGVTVDVRPSTEGARIESVAPGSPAAEAGLRAGDVVVEFDGVPVSDGFSLIAAVRAKVPGETVEIVYERGNETRTTDVTLDSAPAE